MLSPALQIPRLNQHRFLQHRSGSHEQNASAICGSEETNSQLRSASPPAQTSTTFLPTSKNSMTNRTAVASLVRDNGERHVFFQEESGIIRESINKANSWTAPIDYVVATDARNNTPLAAFHIPKSTNVSADITIETVRLLSCSTRMLVLSSFNAATSVLHPYQ